MASLAERYRPRTLKQFAPVAEADVVEAVRRVLKRHRDKIPKAFLLTGQSGCGKTTLAYIIAKWLKCHGRDFHECNASDYRGIDAAREIQERARLVPLESACHVWLLDECHGLTPQAQELLLKTVEDGPEYAYFVFATTEPEKLKPTLKRRCTTFELKPRTEEGILHLLESVCKREHATVVEQALQQIADDAMGSPGIALSILEAVIDAEPKHQLAIAKRTAEEKSKVIELCRALMGGKNWKTISGILRSLEDRDAESVRRNVLGYCNVILLKTTGDKAKAAYVVMDCFSEPVFNTGKAGLSLAAYAATVGIG